MDFVVRLIGIIIIATGNTTPDITVDTALAPRASKASYCSGSKIVEAHQAYIRVSTTSIADESQWKHTLECDPSIKQPCYLFEIPMGSELAIAPGFPMTGSHGRGPTYCQLPSLLDADPSIKLIANPRSSSYFAYEFPAVPLEAIVLNNGLAATFFWMHPSGAPTEPGITVTATPFGSSTASNTLKLNPGTTINILYLPKDDAQGDLNAFHPHGPHFYLANELLSAADEICDDPPTPRPLIVDSLGKIKGCGKPSGDPFCSNNGCCP